MLITTLLALVIILSLLSTAVVVNQSTDQSIESSINRIGQVVKSQFDAEIYKLNREAKLISALPVLRSVIETNDIATIKDSTQDYQKELNLPVFYVFNKKGELLVNAGIEIPQKSSEYWLPILNKSGLDFIDDKLVLYAVSKVGIGGNNSGFIMIGTYIDEKFLGQLKTLSDSNIILSLNKNWVGLKEDANNFIQISEYEKKYNISKAESLFKDTDFIYKFLPLSEIIKNYPGVMIFKLSFKTFQDIRNKILSTIASLGLLIFFIACGAGVIVSGALSKPIIDLTQISRRVIETNDLSLRAKEDGKDEVLILAKVFNELLHQLKLKRDELITYNLNLEEKVKDRTLKISQMVDNLETLLNSLNEGFLVFESNGIVLPGSSLICRELFLTDPTGQSFAKLISNFSENYEEISDWINIIFNGSANFDAIAEIGPTELWHTDRSKYITLQFRPIYFKEPSKSSQVEKVICIAKDSTEEQRLREEIENDSKKMEMVLAITQYQDEFRSFIKLFSEKITYHKSFIEKFLSNNSSSIFDRNYIVLIKRDLHTLKGGASTFYLTQLVQKLHQTEDYLINMELSLDKQKSVAIFDCLTEIESEIDQFLKSNVHLFGESISNEDIIRLARKNVTDYENLLSLELGKKSNLYQKYFETFFLTDITKDLQKYHLTVQQVSKKYNKKVVLNIIPSDVLVLINAYKNFIDSLVHIFSNAIVHGIEDAEIRVSNQKSEIGKIEVSAKHFENQIILSISDDGQGINPERIWNKAVAKNLVKESDAPRYDQNQILKFIFLPDFSTTEYVDEAAGRGVGLNAVEEEVHKLNGEIQVLSNLGLGTTFKFRLPLIRELNMKYPENY